MDPDPSGRRWYAPLNFTTNDTPYLVQVLRHSFF